MKIPDIVNIELRTQSVILTTALIILLIYIAYIYGLLTLLFVLGSIIVHEAGHYIALKYYDYEVDELYFSLTANYIEWDDDGELQPFEDFVITISGIIGSVLTILFIYLTYFIGMIDFFIFINSLYIIGFITFINLAPKSGFDGYNIYTSFYEYITGEKMKEIPIIIWVIYFVLLIFFVVIVTQFTQPSI